MSAPDQVLVHGASGALELRWQDGLSSRLEGPTLRAACRCAQCQSLRRQDRCVPGEGALLQDVRAVGEHGLALGFSDGHARGIYPWVYLRELACQRGARQEVL